MSYRAEIDTVIKQYELLIVRLSKGLRESKSSQKKIAQKMGVSINTITNWKKNPLNVPPSKLQKLAKLI